MRALLGRQGTRTGRIFTTSCIRFWILGVYRLGEELQSSCRLTIDCLIVTWSAAIWSNDFTLSPAEVWAPCGAKRRRVCGFLVGPLGYRRVSRRTGQHAGYLCSRHKYDLDVCLLATNLDDVPTWFLMWIQLGWCVHFVYFMCPNYYSHNIASIRDLIYYYISRLFLYISINYLA